MEAEARPEKLFGGGGPLLCPWSSGGDPKQICLPWHVCCSPESRRAVPEPAAVVAAAALALGVVLSPPTCGGVLLLKISGSLQGGSSPSSAASVGSAEDGWRPCLRLRREVMMAAWRRLEADTPSASRFRGLRRMDSAASQQGWSTSLLRCEVCVVVPCSSGVASSSPVFVRACSSLF